MVAEAADAAPFRTRALGGVRGYRRLFESLEITLQPGEVLLVEGANGAGKTSLLRLLCGLALPTEGEVYWHGEPLPRCRLEFQQSLLYLGHTPGVKLELSPRENLRFLAALHGLSVNPQQLDDILDTVGLYGFETVPARALSAGQRRRIALARLWFAEQALWVLDEPFTAIDRAGVARLEARLMEHAARGGMAVLTSHQALQLTPAPRRLAL